MTRYNFGDRFIVERIPTEDRIFYRICDRWCNETVMVNSMSTLQSQEFFLNIVKRLNAGCSDRLFIRYISYFAAINLPRYHVFDRIDKVGLMQSDDINECVNFVCDKKNNPAIVPNIPTVPNIPPIKNTNGFKCQNCGYNDAVDVNAANNMLKNDKKMKMIRCEMPDGSQWDIPAKIVAHNRASYVVSQPGGADDRSQTYKKVYEETMRDEYILFDWAEQGMPWDLVKQFAVCHKKMDEKAYQIGWESGHKCVVSM